MAFRVCTGAVPIGSACAGLNIKHDCANRALQLRRLWCMPPKAKRVRTVVNHRAMRGVAGTFASSPDNLEVCWEFLKDYTLKDARGRGQDVRDSAEGRDRMRASIQTVMQEPWPDSGWVPGPGQEVLLGVLASDIRYAVRALRDWCDELDLPHHRLTSRVPGVESIAQVQGSVYIKYNSFTGLCYVTTYSGQDRGVLLQLAQQQLGHFPLGLFDEAMEKPPPTL